jgi:CheY-like chemotaxis protein
MDASERVSWADCPSCGGLVAVGWLDGDPVAVDCAAGCPLRVEDVRISAASRVRAGMVGDVEQMASILEDAVLETTQAYGLSDPRVAAALVADAWADILREEGRSPRLVELATMAVREVGDRLHRRQVAAGPHKVRDPSDDIRVLVVDHHPLARLRLREMFTGEADLSVVGECENGWQVVEAAARLRPHVVCMDRYMPIVDGLAATQALRAAEGEVGIIVLTDDRPARRQIALAGADAVVPRDAGRDALLRCLRTVARRGTGCPYCLGSGSSTRRGTSPAP